MRLRESARAEKKGVDGPGGFGQGPLPFGGAGKPVANERSALKTEESLEKLKANEPTFEQSLAWIPDRRDRREQVLETRVLELGCRKTANERLTEDQARKGFRWMPRH